MGAINMAYSIIQKTVYGSTEQEDEYKVVQHTMTILEAIKAVFYLTGVERFNTNVTRAIDGDFPVVENSYYFEKWEDDLDS